MFDSIPSILVVSLRFSSRCWRSRSSWAGNSYSAWFNDTGRRSEGRRKRRAFEWSVRACFGCANYLWAVQEIRELSQQFALGMESKLTVVQVGLVVVGLVFAVVAV